MSWVDSLISQESAALSNHHRRTYSVNNLGPEPSQKNAPELVQSPVLRTNVHQAKQSTKEIPSAATRQRPPPHRPRAALSCSVLFQGSFAEKKKGRKRAAALPTIIRYSIIWGDLQTHQTNNTISRDQIRAEPRPQQRAYYLEAVRRLRQCSNQKPPQRPDHQNTPPQF